MELNGCKWIDNKEKRGIAIKLLDEEVQETKFKENQTFYHCCETVMIPRRIFGVSKDIYPCFWSLGK